MRYFFVLIAVVMIATFAPVWGQNVSDPTLADINAATKKVNSGSYRPARSYARSRSPRNIARKSDIWAAERRVSNQISSGFKGSSKQLSEINSSLKQLVDLQTKQAEASKPAPAPPPAAPAPVPQGTTQTAPATPPVETPQGDNPPAPTPTETSSNVQPDDKLPVGGRPPAISGEESRRRMFVGASQEGAAKALQSEDGQVAIEDAVRSGVGLKPGQRVATATDVAANAYKPNFFFGMWQSVVGVLFVLLAVAILGGSVFFIITRKRR